MLVEEVAALTNLDIAQAVRARARDYTEPFVIEASGEPNEVTRLAQECGLRGLRVLRGARFWTASGKHDKGRAVRYVIERYARPGTRPVTYAIGDYWNDRDMLEAADASFLVQRPDGRWADFEIPGLVRIDGIGPAGWLEAAGQVLAAHSQREAG